jgi:hypothetical protein
MSVLRYITPPRSRPGTSIADRMIDAMAGGNVVDFIYDGKYRVVEIHAVGQSTAGKLVARGLQIAGAASRPLPQWTLFDLGKVELYEDRPQRSDAPREGYAMGDKQMSPVFAELAL